MTNKIITFVILSILSINLFADNGLSIMYPKYSKGEIVEHTYYTLSYSEEDEQAFWVIYKLSKSMVLSNNASRCTSFRKDKQVSTQSASPKDYTKTGYDRGHLCPAASMSINQIAMMESFYMSNVSPQTPSFNRGGWKKLEETVRDWAIEEELVYVVTGPVLNDRSNKIGRITVPTHFYKIIYSPFEKKMIAFLMPNDSIVGNISDYSTTVNDIEEITGIDFFEYLDDKVEEKLEGNINLNEWAF